MTQTAVLPDPLQAKVNMDTKSLFPISKKTHGVSIIKTKEIIMFTETTAAFTKISERVPVFYKGSVHS